MTKPRGDATPIKKYGGTYMPRPYGPLKAKKLEKTFKEGYG
tara:strand:- start:68 stop:190 length:123 start_codon:yes stop_codon:yes gene_type:complete